MENDNTRQYSPEAVTAERKKGRTHCYANAPVRPVDEDFWRDAHVVMPPLGKAPVHPRLDAPVLEWFRAQGRSHPSGMNAVLRSFMGNRKR